MRVEVSGGGLGASFGGLPFAVLFPGKVGHSSLSFQLLTFPQISTVSPNRLNPANSLNPLDFRYPHSNLRLPFE